MKPKRTKVKPKLKEYDCANCDNLTEDKESMITCMACFRLFCSEACYKDHRIFDCNDELLFQDEEE